MLCLHVFSFQTYVRFLFFLYSVLLVGETPATAHYAHNQTPPGLRSRSLNTEEWILLLNQNLSSDDKLVNAKANQPTEVQRTCASTSTKSEQRFDIRFERSVKLISDFESKTKSEELLDARAQNINCAKSVFVLK